MQLLALTAFALASATPINGPEALFFAQDASPAASLAAGAQHPPVIGGAPIAGGWSAIANADTDPEVRAASKAVMAQIPAGKARLRHIEKAERQVVAGTNIHLILRLSNGRRWEATVWHKLDGSFEVGKLSRVN